MKTDSAFDLHLTAVDDRLSAVEGELSTVGSELGAIDDQLAAIDARLSVADDESSTADEQLKPNDNQPNGGEDELSMPEVRRRAVTGAVVDALRGIGVRLLGLLGTLVTARLLTPYDFGLVAVGTTVFTFGIFLSDGGVGAALIRRAEAPRRAELQALLAFQLGLDVILVLAVGLVMMPFGLLGQVTTVIAASLPLGALRVPAVILYERRLNYRPMAIVEVAETCVYYVWAIVTIAIGWGVWGLATAFVVRAVFWIGAPSTLLPEGRLVPVPSWTKVRRLLGFGFRYQTVGLLQMLDDQLVNVGVATFGGVAMLGVWGVAWRILQIPISLFVALWRVSYPAMSRLVAAGEDAGSTIERVIEASRHRRRRARRAGRSLRLGLDPCAHWRSMGDGRIGDPAGMLRYVFRRANLGCSLGYLWAIGAASVPLRATLVGIPAMALVLVPLIPAIGVVAVGFAYVASASIESAFFVCAARRTVSFRIRTRLGIPVLLAIVSGTCGWLVAQYVGANLAGALSSSAVALGVFLGGLAAVHRPDLADAWTLIGRGLRGAIANSADTGPKPQPKPATG